MKQDGYNYPQAQDNSDAAIIAAAKNQELPEHAQFAITELAAVQRVLADVQRVLAHDWGVRPIAVRLQPAKELQALASTQRDLDYRDAYMAALTSGRSESMSKASAASAVTHLAERRGAQPDSECLRMSLELLLELVKLPSESEKADTIRRSMEELRAGLRADERALLQRISLTIPSHDEVDNG